MAKQGKHELQIRYEIEAEPDSARIRGNFASGDAAEDRALEDSLIARADSGDVWAWCEVRVWAVSNGVRAASDWLGGCSYESEANYIASDTHYTSQCEEAAERLFAFTQSHRQGIQTKYIGPTNSRGARVKAWAQAGAIYVSWDHALGIPENHLAAAREYAQRWGWAGRWIGGATPDGSGYLFVNDTHAEAE